LSASERGGRDLDESVEGRGNYCPGVVVAGNELGGGVVD
jgi:hypothetical protein